MDERVCMSKELKWNNFPFYGERLSGKVFNGDYHLQTACLRKSLKWRQVVWRSYSEQMSEKTK